MASDYADPAARAHIAAASLHAAPPPAAPQGLTRLSTLWTAPLGRYAPPCVTNPIFGYLLSAMFRVGVVTLISFGIARIAARRAVDQVGRK